MTDTTFDKGNEGWIYQTSLKNAAGTMVNIRGRNEEEFEEALRLYEKYGPRFGFSSTPQTGPTQYVTPTTDRNTQMQTKQAPPSTGGDSVIVTIEDVEQFQGEKNGKPWVKYTVNKNKNWTTFDKKLGFALSKMLGVTLKLNLKQNGQFWNIDSFAEASELV
jgi:hypothetical protein